MFNIYTHTHTHISMVAAGLHTASRSYEAPIYFLCRSLKAFADVKRRGGSLGPPPPPQLFDARGKLQRKSLACTVLAMTDCILITLLLLLLLLLSHARLICTLSLWLSARLQ